MNAAPHIDPSVFANIGDSASLATESGTPGAMIEGPNCFAARIGAPVNGW
jgi:hypothetical protein